VKVRELIGLLQAHDPEAEVITEGCDCIGEANSVSRDGAEVCINRGLQGDWPGRLEAEAATAQKTLDRLRHEQELKDLAIARMESWDREIEDMTKETDGT
jgi:hypothetical protein